MKTNRLVALIISQVAVFAALSLIVIRTLGLRISDASELFAGLFIAALMSFVCFGTGVVIYSTVDLIKRVLK
jgi:hypothetical protein